MTIFEAVLVAIPFAAATWAAWWIPRWADEDRGHVGRQQKHRLRTSEPVVTTPADC